MSDLITQHLNESKKSITQFKVFMALLDAMIVFAVFSIVFSVFGITIFASFAPAILYFLYKVLLAYKDNTIIQKISKKAPSLDQQLAAAYDNRNESNVIAEHLIKEVSKKLDELHASAFLERREMISRVFVVITLFFALVAVNSIYVQDVVLKFRTSFFDGFTDLLFGGGGDGSGDRMTMGMGDNWQTGNHSAKDEKEKIGGESGGKTPGYSEGPLPGQGGGVGASGSRNIYGAPTTARIEGQNINMEVHPEYGGQIDIEDTTTKERAKTNFKVPEEVEATRNPEQEPVEYAEVIKKYFEKLSQEDLR